MSESINAVKEQLHIANSFVDIFGTLPEGEAKQKLRTLRKSFGYLASIVHPDKVKGDELEAGPVFAELKNRYDKAKIAVKDGRYEDGFSYDTSSVAPTPFTTASGGVYTLDDTVFKEGDFSTFYKARDKKGQRVLVKISSDPTLNGYLESEAKILKRFLVSKKTLRPLRKFVPTLLDTFMGREENGKQFRALVFPFLEGYVSLTDIIAAYPNGLNPKDAAWIWRRVLAQALAAKMAGYVHGAIVPDHVLVHPTTHEPLHIGWAHAIQKPEETSKRITFVIDAWRDWYPPEVFKKQVPDHSTDIFMAGKTMIYLLGGDTKRNTFPKGVPEEIKRIILRTVKSSADERSRDAKVVINDFQRAITKRWGRSYRQLVLPNR